MKTKYSWLILLQTFLCNLAASHLCAQMVSLYSFTQLDTEKFHSLQSYTVLEILLNGLL